MGVAENANSIMKTITFLILSLLALPFGSLVAGHPHHVQVDPVREHVVVLGNATSKLEASNRRGYEATARRRAATRAEVDFRSGVIALNEAVCALVDHYESGNVRHNAVHLTEVRECYGILCDIARHIGLGDTTKGYLRLIGREVGHIEEAMRAGHYRAEVRGNSRLDAYGRSMERAVVAAPPVSAPPRYVPVLPQWGF